MHAVMTKPASLSDNIRVTHVANTSITHALYASGSRRAVSIATSTASGHDSDGAVVTRAEQSVGRGLRAYLHGDTTMTPSMWSPSAFQTPSAALELRTCT